MLLALSFLGGHTVLISLAIANKDLSQKEGPGCIPQPALRWDTELQDG